MIRYAERTAPLQEALEAEVAMLLPSYSLRWLPPLQARLSM